MASSSRRTRSLKPETNLTGLYHPLSKRRAVLRKKKSRNTLLLSVIIIVAVSSVVTFWCWQVRISGAVSGAGVRSEGWGQREKVARHRYHGIRKVVDRSGGEGFVPGDGSGGELTNAALLVVAYNRPDYLRRTLDSLAEVSSLGNITVYVSQDGAQEDVGMVAKAAGANLGTPRTRGYQHWQRQRVPQLGSKQPGHAWLAQHYKWAIDRIFHERGHSHVIIAEDDMLFSKDFVTFFQQTAVLLERDPSLWCVSTWNDNGLERHAIDPKALYRTSYFPGLGWMMRRELWEEIGPKWPKEHWDHWMRLDTTSNGRECVIPEVNRNYNIGEVGANMQPDSYNNYVKRMSFSTQEVENLGDISYIVFDAYRDWLVRLIEDAVTWPWQSENSKITLASFLNWAKTNQLTDNARQIESGLGRAGELTPILALYRSENYETLAKALDLWPFPRGHSQHAAVVHVGGFTVVVADERYCPYLPSRMRMESSPGLRRIAAKQGQDCNEACATLGMRCHAPDFWFLNSCEALAEHFPCEAGCAMVLGGDVPNYVVGKKMNTFQKCLVTEKQPACRASHPSTARLCPCV